jgi:PEP-CTERM motif
MLRKITRLVPFVIFMLLLSPLALADRSDGNDDSSSGEHQSSSNHDGSNDDKGGKKPVAVPEPSTIALGGTALLGIAGAMRRKFRA